MFILDKIEYANLETNFTNILTFKLNSLRLNGSWNKTQIEVDFIFPCFFFFLLVPFAFSLSLLLRFLPKHAKVFSSQPIFTTQQIYNLHLIFLPRHKISRKNFSFNIFFVFFFISFKN